MPTEREFLDAAKLFDNAGDEVSDVPNLVASAFGPDVATGGQLALEIDALITQTTGACNADDGALDDLARLCRERAEIVAHYAVDVRSYNTRLSSHSYAYNRWLGDVREWEDDPDINHHPGNRPNPPHRPNKPASWVET